MERNIRFEYLTFIFKIAYYEITKMFHIWKINNNNDTNSIPEINLFTSYCNYKIEKTKYYRKERKLTNYETQHIERMGNGKENAEGKNL